MASNSDKTNERMDKTSSEAGAYLVCDGATCTCSEALNPAPVELKITSQNKIFINDSQLIATVKDNNMAIPVAPFIQCKQNPKTGKPCEYSPSSSWEWSPDVGTIHPEIKGMKILTENAFLRCPKIPSAKITFLTHGQIIDILDDALEELDDTTAIAIICLYEKIEEQPDNKIIPSVRSIQVENYKSAGKQPVTVPIRTNKQYEFTAEYTEKTKNALYNYWYIRPQTKNEKTSLKFNADEGLLYKQTGNKIALKINEAGKYYIEGFGQLINKSGQKKIMFADCTLLLDVQENKFKQIKISPPPVTKVQETVFEVWNNQSYTIDIETLFELTDAEKESLAVTIEDSDQNLVKQYSSHKDISFDDYKELLSPEQRNDLDNQEKINKEYQTTNTESSFLMIKGSPSFKLQKLNEGIYYVTIKVLDEPEKKYTFHAIANKLNKLITCKDIPSSHKIRSGIKVKLQAQLVNSSNTRSLTWYVDDIKQPDQHGMTFDYTFRTLGKHTVYASLFQLFGLGSKTDKYTVEVINNAVTTITPTPAKQEYTIGATIEFKAETIFTQILTERNEGIIWKLSPIKTGESIQGAKPLEIVSNHKQEIKLPEGYIQLGDVKNVANTLKVKFNQIGEYELSAFIGKTKVCKASTIKINYAHIDDWKFVDSQQQPRKNIGWGQPFVIYMKVKGWEDKKISIQLWYDNRSKNTKERFKKIGCEELKIKQDVKSDGSCLIEIKGDDFWNSFEKVVSSESKGFRFFFTVSDVDSICDNSNVKTAEALPGHIFPKETNNTYAYIPDKTGYKGYFADNNGTLLTDIIEYKDQAKVIIWIKNKKGDSYLENKYNLYIYENKKEKDPLALPFVEKQFGKEGKIEYSIPMGYLKSLKEKDYPKHALRFFYFRLERVYEEWYIPNKFVYTYPESYGLGKDNDINIIQLNKDDYTPEEIKANEELWGYKSNLNSIINIKSLGKESIKPLYPLDIKEMEKEEQEKKEKKDSENRKKQAEGKNKEAKQENIRKIEQGKNYHFQLKIAEEAQQQRSRYTNTGKRIGSAIGSEKKDRNECVCKKYNLVWGAKVSCEFRKKVVEIAKELNLPQENYEGANWLMTIMALETAYTFKASKGNGLGYYGLIQFGNAAAQTVNSTTDELKKMTELKQLDYVKKYFEQNSFKGKLTNMVNLYMAVNYPENVRRNKTNKDDIIYVAPKLAYHQNRPFHKEVRTINGIEVLEKNNIANYRKNKDGTFMLDKKGNKVPLYGFQDGITYIWEVLEALEAIYRQGASATNRGMEGRCEFDNSTVQITGRTPWMKIAIDLAIQMKGCKEGIEPMYSNAKKYLRYCGNPYEPTDGDRGPWCASFMNWAISQSVNPNTSEAYKHEKSASSLAPIGSKQYKKIEKPIYGCIVVYKHIDSKKWKGHTGFLYGMDKSNKYILLGGNQSDTIMFNSYGEYTSNSKTKKLYGFYIPIDYEITEKDYLTKSDIYENDSIVNTEYGIKKSGDKNKTV